MPNNVRVGVQTTGVGKASSEFDRLRDKVDQLQKKGAKGFAIGAGAAVTAAGIGLISNAVGGLTDKVGEATEAASNLEQSVGAVQSVFGPASDTIEKFGETADQSLGLSKRAVNELAAVTGAQLKSFGFSAEEAAKEAINLQKRAADLAATFGGPTADAVQAISALMRGERDPIERYGVSLKQADIDARVMAKGLDTSTVAAKKHSDAIASLELFYEQTADAAGQFAREADSAAGSQARAQAKYENGMARLGERLLPAVADSASTAADVLENLANVLDLMGGKIPETEEGLDNLIGALNGINLNPLTIAWQNTWNEIDAKADEAAAAATESLHFMADAAKDEFASVDASSGPARYALERLGMTAEEAAEATDKAMRDMVEAVQSAGPDLEAAASDAADSLYDPIILKAQLAEIERTQAEVRAERNAAAAHSRERQEASDHLVELEKNWLETLGALAAAGDKEAQARLEAFVATRKASGKLSAAQIADLDRLIAKINAARGVFVSLARANFMANASKDDAYIPGRAAGGPVHSGQTYLVGENGPELLHMGGGANGTINNSVGGMGGMTFAPTVVVQGVATPATVSAIVNELGPAFADYLTRAGWSAR